jgi:aminopeptidase N
VPLGWFFDQWLTRAGMPKLRGAWQYDAAAKQIRIELTQIQAGPAYRLPLEIGVAGPSGPSRVERIELTEASGRFAIAAEVEPVTVSLDPNTWVLMEAPEFTRR